MINGLSRVVIIHKEIWTELRRILDANAISIQCSINALVLLVVSCRQFRQCMNQCLIGTFVQTIGLRVIRAADAMLNSGTLVQSSVEKEYTHVHNIHVHVCVHSQHCGKVGTN